jgi:hypothetical protein
MSTTVIKNQAIVDFTQKAEAIRKYIISHLPPSIPDLFIERGNDSPVEIKEQVKQLLGIKQKQNALNSQQLTIYTKQLIRQG